MDRRDFLRLTGMATATAVVPSAAVFAADAPGGRWRMFEVTTHVEVARPAGVSRVWLPTPLTHDTLFEKALGNEYEAQGGTSGYVVDAHGVGMVWAEWPQGAPPVLVLKSRFATRDVAVDLSRPGRAQPESAEALAYYTAPTQHMATTGAVKELSTKIVAGAQGDVGKARAIYEWIVDNTYRDPKTRGCGTGDVNFMVETKTWGGKCADLNALFVALARSQGIPARDVYGVRVANSALGYHSLGKSGDITKAQHCRAQFYSAEHGWVPVDPADVRKVILEESGGKKIDDPMVVAARKRLFGSWEMNWVAYNYGNDVSLPGSAHGVLPFLLYPQGETAEGRLDCLDADHFKYQMTSREIA